MAGPARRRGLPPAASRTSPAPATAPSAAHRTRSASPAAHTAEDAEDLLEEIAAIDIAFEEGLIAPDTYERLRTAAKDRLATRWRGAVRVTVRTNPRRLSEGGGPMAAATQKYGSGRKMVRRVCT